MASLHKKRLLFFILALEIAQFFAAVDFDFIDNLHKPKPYNDTDQEPHKQEKRGNDLLMDPVLKRSTLDVMDNEIEGRSTQSIVEEVETRIEELIRQGFERANKILKEQKNAAVTTRGSNFIQFHSPVVADVNIQHAADCRGLGMLETSKLIAEEYKIPKEEAEITLRLIKIPEGICRSIETDCFTSGRHLTRQETSAFVPSPTCNAQFKYRNVDGKCNNLKHPRRAAAGTIFNRFIAPDYKDGVNLPRVSLSGGPLPGPRVVSNALFNSNPNPAPNNEWTQLLKGWGQFLDHDITRTPEAVVLDNTGKPRAIDCCDDGRFPTTPVTADCMPINVTGDPFYRSHGISCLRFVRSVASDCATCGLRARTQINAITHTIDASQIYGSNFVDQQNLRLFRGGQLKTTNNIVEPGRCPASTRACDLSFMQQIVNPDTNSLRFVSGDVRVDEQPGLTCLHTVFTRYHNMLARALSGLNPQWNDETLYQESRRIIGALMQQITYSEFLPIVLGQRIMIENQLVPISQGFLAYNESVDPSITVAFATAAYRFGHTLIGANLMGSNGQLLPLQRNFNDDTVIMQPGKSPSHILRGEWFLLSEEFDVNFVSAIRNRLFASGPDFSVGLDLMAVNIMRGREHGVPGYNAWRKFCGLPTFSSFDELSRSGVMNPRVVLELSKHYLNVGDIDLYVAGLAENKAVSGFLGPTFACLVARQFKNLRFGDRFWFENGNLPSSFTGRQLFSIKRTTLSSIFCETTVTTSVQPFSQLTTIFSGNQIQPCSNINQISLLNPSNLAAWKV